MAEPRVRLFTLAAERWDACGGGLVRIAGALLTVAPEDAPDEEALRLPAADCSAVRCEQKNIITLTLPDERAVALSFQNDATCDHVWKWLAEYHSLDPDLSARVRLEDAPEDPADGSGSDEEPSPVRRRRQLRTLRLSENADDLGRQRIGDHDEEDAAASPDSSSDSGSDHGSGNSSEDSEDMALEDLFRDNQTSARGRHVHGDANTGEEDDDIDSLDLGADSTEDSDASHNLLRSLLSNTNGMFPMRAMPDPLPPTDLPAISREALPEIEKTVTSISQMRIDATNKMDFSNKNRSLMACEKVWSKFDDEGGINKLRDVFHECERDTDLPSLHLIYKIIRGLLALCQNAVIEKFFETEDVTMDLFGMLEHDPSSSAPRKHRTFLTETAVFREVVPLRDASVIDMIHQAYRVQYLKDSILYDLVDEFQANYVGSFLAFLNVTVIDGLREDTDALKELLSRLGLPTSDQLIADSVKFARELCSFAHSIVTGARMQFFQALVDAGIIPAIGRLFGLAASTPSIIAPAVDMLTNVVLHNIGAVRANICLARDPTNNLMHRLVHAFVSTSVVSELYAISALFHQLLDVDPENRADSNVFLQLSYTALNELMPIFTAPAPPADQLGARAYRERLVMTMNLLGHGLHSHSYHAKTMFLRGSYVNKVLPLLHGSDQIVAMAVVRLIRAITALNLDFYSRYLVMHHVFGFVVDALEGTRGQYNALNSALLELLEYIRATNITMLIEHVGEHYGTRLKEIKYSRSVGNFLTAYQKILDDRDRADSLSTAAEIEEPISTNPRLRLKRKDSIDVREDEYFSTENDDRDGETGVSSSETQSCDPPTPTPLPRTPRPPMRPRSSLVSYDEDDEDEDGDLTTRRAPPPKMPRMETKIILTTTSLGGPEKP